jgi:hypothetical protein
MEAIGNLEMFNECNGSQCCRKVWCYRGRGVVSSSTWWDWIDYYSLTI